MYLCIFFTCACVFLVWPVDVYLALAVSVFLLLPFAELILIASFCAALLLLSERTSLYFHVLWPTSLLLFCFGCCTSVLYAHMLVYSYLSWPCTTCVELFGLSLCWASGLDLIFVPEIKLMQKCFVYVFGLTACTVIHCVCHRFFVYIIDIFVSISKYEKDKTNRLS